MDVLSPLLQGEIIFDETAQFFDYATCFVSLLDTTVADGRSEIILRQVIPNVSFDPSVKNKLPFVLYGNIPDIQADYTLEVLIDLDGDERISLGDYINVQSYPVLTRGYPDTISVQVKRVT